MSASELENCLEQNTGVNVLEWPERGRIAVGLLTELPPPLPPEGTRDIADFGCGRQTLRPMLPANWRYVPYDYLPRTPDTVICDFNKQLPAGPFGVVFSLGVIEYLQEPLKYLGHAAAQCDYLIFSYCGFWTAEQRVRQGWQNNLSWEEIEATIRMNGGAVMRIQALEKNERVYLCRGRRRKISDGE